MAVLLSLVVILIVVAVEGEWLLHFPVATINDGLVAHMVMTGRLPGAAENVHDLAIPIDLQHTAASGLSTDKAPQLPLCCKADVAQVVIIRMSVSMIGYHASWDATQEGLRDQVGHLMSTRYSILAQIHVGGTAPGLSAASALGAVAEGMKHRHLTAGPDVTYLTVNTDLVLTVIARDVFPFGHYLTSSLALHAFHVLSWRHRKEVKSMLDLNLSNEAEALLCRMYQRYLLCREAGDCLRIARQM